MFARLLTTAFVFASVSRVAAQTIDDMDAVRFEAPRDEQKNPRATASLVPGKQGKAVRFDFGDKCQSALFTRRLQPDASWDQAEGFSFWVRGDGSDHLGGIELIHADDYSRRYAFAFSIRDTGWRKIAVAWRDLLPETAAAPFLDRAPAGAAPSRFTSLFIGKWWYWRDYAAHSFELDEIVLEPKVAAAAVAPPRRLVDTLKAGQTITIATMGDSLTDVAHWANRKTNWPALLKERLAAECAVKVNLVNPALGGTELKQNLILMTRWTETTKPDVVTVFFGYNDWSSGMRGPHWKETLANAIDHIRRQTGAEVILLTTIPSVERWDAMAELAQAAREVVQAKGAILADTEKAFHAAGDADVAARERLYCDDKVHLGDEGHRLVAETVLAAIRAASASR